jgi:hypothetical protein
MDRKIKIFVAAPIASDRVMSLLMTAARNPKQKE